ncbi:unnamed protein product, partial [marine sediment metagenome]
SQSSQSKTLYKSQDINENEASPELYEQKHLLDMQRLINLQTDSAKE